MFLPVSTSTKSIKIDQETPELLSKTKWHGFFMAHGVYIYIYIYIYKTCKEWAVRFTTQYERT